jgi:hypothetical protein
LIANTAALFTLVRASSRGIPEDQVQDLDTSIIRTITSSMPVITKSIPVLTNSIHLPNGGRVKVDKNAHNQSVTYARMVAEHEKAKKAQRNKS